MHCLQEFIKRRASELTCLSRVYLQVGMQNSSLGVVLASSHFTSPTVTLPAAMSAVIMNIMGSSLGFFWRYVNPSESTNSPKLEDQ